MATNNLAHSEMTKNDGLEHSVIDRSSSLSERERGHGNPELVNDGAGVSRMGKRKEFFAYIKTKQFWVVLLLGYVGHLVM